MSQSEQTERLCHLPGQFVPCDPAELQPLVDFLRRDEPVTRDTAFPRGTLLPDGRLDLCKQRVGPHGAQLVAEAVKHNHHVSSLMLGADGLGNTGARAVADAVRASESLTTVYLGCNHIDQEGTTALAEAVRDNPRIRGLWLKRNPIGVAGARALAGLLREHRGLRALDLVSTGLDRDGLRLIVEAVVDEGCSLERLYLCGNRITADDAGLLAGLIRTNRTLRSLYLSVNRLGDPGTVAIAAALHENSSLRELSLSSNGIGPTGARVLAEAVCEHPALRVLELGYEQSTQVHGEQGNHVGDDGAVALASMLRRNRTLTSLDLLRNGLTDRGGRALRDALEQNTTLTALVLGKAISPALKRELQRLLARNRQVACPSAGDPDIRAIRSVYRVET